MLEEYFNRFRKNVIGINQEFESPYGSKKIIYADWTASGRLYRPIEEIIMNKIGPFVGNTHTGTTLTGKRMTEAYHYALRYIKKHVNAHENDVIISSNSGMTGVVNKFQRILGLKLHEKYQRIIHFKPNEQPLVLVTHMEHHSNQTSWIETTADVRIIPSNANGLVDLEGLNELLERNKNRKTIIAAVTSYSNVTGIGTPYYEIAEIMHRHGGLCFVDFACSAPYIHIDMHPVDELKKLDAIYFSPHKFLGGPGSTGILIFNKELYHNRIPDCPGGGTVEWTNPWGGHKYVDDIEQREDGGTPAFLQTIKVALAIRLKNEMKVEMMLKREHEMLNIIWPRLEKISNLHILAPNIKERLGVISFYIDELHYNLAVRLLNDKFGIQTRGGCSCAGTYGHFLLHVDIDTSNVITNKISSGDLSIKPGWIRMSLHPIMLDEEIVSILDAIDELAKKHKSWKDDYVYEEHTNEFTHKDLVGKIDKKVRGWIESDSLL
jgi:selenocysteine lyase/cysteine desulfurase